MHDTAVEVDLVGLARLLEDLLRLVAFLGGEDGVGLSSGDGEGSSNGRQLVLVHEGRVSDVTDLDAVLVVADDVLKVGTVRQSYSSLDTTDQLQSCWGRGKPTLAPKQ